MSPDSAISSERVVLGGGCEIDEGVLVGYPTDKIIQSERLIIGKNARIRSGSVIYCGSRIGDNLQTGHNVLIREENVIGENFRIWNNSVVDYRCVIGNNVKIHCGVYIAQYTVIEDDVFMAPGVVVANDIHPGCSHSGQCMKGPIIRKGAQIGVNATLLPFITIGEGSVVGGGSVVTRDVPPRSVIYGNPARVARSVDSIRCISGLTDKPYGKHPIWGGSGSRT